MLILPLVFAALAAQALPRGPDGMIGQVVGPVIVGPVVTSYRAECDPADPDRCSQPLDRGEQAPFAGQLMTPQLAVDLSLWVEECEARRAADIARLERTHRLDRKFWTETVAAEQQRNKDLMTRMDLLEREQKSHDWWGNVKTAAAVSASLALVAVVVAVR